MTRRNLIAAGLGAAAATLKAADPRFKVSLAQWSLHRAIQSRLLSNLDFPRVAREQFGIEGLEFVNQLWAAPTRDYVKALKKNVASTGTQAVLIMIDGEGELAHSQRIERLKAAENHFRWCDIAAELGCHAIRVNMYTDAAPKTPAEMDSFYGWAQEGFGRLCEFAAGRKLNVLIENHGGISGNADILTGFAKKAKLQNLGLLPDFGNFDKGVDKYESIRKMMPYARAVSFKCFEFGPNLSHPAIDLDRMMKLVADSKYSGWIGIEFEGEKQAEFEGIAAAKRYLEKWIR